MPLQKMRVLLFLLFIAHALTACDSFTTETESKILEDVNKDIVAPTILSIIPEDGAADLEVDSSVTVTFSELMNIEILDKPFTIELEVEEIVGEADESEGVEAIYRTFSAGVILYEGVFENFEDISLADERPRHIDYSVKLGVGIDPITSNFIDVDTTVLSLQHQSGRFALNTNYTVLISEHVIDLADDLKTKNTIEGNKLGDNRNIQFKTEDGEWESNITLAFSEKGTAEGETELLEGNQFVPQLTSNDAGDVLALWQQNNSGGTNDTLGVWASRYSPKDERWVLSGASSSENSGLENAERIDDKGLVASAFGPKIAINESGKAVATWYQETSGSAISSIWVNVFDIDSGTNNYQWGGAKTVQETPSGFDSSMPEVGIDDDGNMIAVWLEVENGNKYLKSSYYDAATPAWFGEPVIINSPFSGEARHLTLSYSSDGSGLVAWSQEDSGVFNIYTSHFMGNAWSEPKKLNVSNLPADQFSGASNPKVAVDKNNDAFVVWQQHDNKRENIWFSRFSGGIWSEASMLENDNVGDAIDPYIAFGKDGQAFAIWVQAKNTNGVINNAVFAKYYSQDTGWESIIDLSEGSSIVKPIVQFDYEGNAIASWVVDQTVESVRYSKITSSWLGVEKHTFRPNNAQSINLAPLLKDGRFIKVWTEFKDSGFKLFSTLFTD
jgi:hypothetical protein